MPRINKSKYAILGVINKRPLSGYDIKQIFSHFAPHHWSESNAQIYPMLKSLEKQGLLTSTLDSKSGGRQKRIYQITLKGQQELNQWLRDPIEMPIYREELLLKMSNNQHLEPELNLKYIKDYQAYLLNRQQHLSSVMQHIKEDHAGRDDQLNLLLVYRHAELAINAKLTWCEEALREIQDLLAKSPQGH